MSRCPKTTGLRQTELLQTCDNATRCRERPRTAAKTHGVGSAPRCEPSGEGRAQRREAARPGLRWGGRGEGTEGLSKAHRTDWGERCVCGEGDPCLAAPCRAVPALLGTGTCWGSGRGAGHKAQHRGSARWGPPGKTIWQQREEGGAGRRRWGGSAGRWAPSRFPFLTPKRDPHPLRSQRPRSRPQPPFFQHLEQHRHWL